MIVMRILTLFSILVLSSCVGIEIDSTFRREVPVPYNLTNSKNWDEGGRTVLIQHSPGTKLHLDSRNEAYTLSRSELIEKLGSPHNILYENDREVYYYRSGLTYSKGVTIWLLVPIPIKSSGYDREFYVYFGGDKVDKVIENRNENKAYGTIWLFSEIASGFTY